MALLRRPTDCATAIAICDVFEILFNNNFYLIIIIHF